MQTEACIKWISDLTLSAADLCGRRPRQMGSLAIIPQEPKNPKLPQKSLRFPQSLPKKPNRAFHLLASLRDGQYIYPYRNAGWVSLEAYRQNSFFIADTSSF